MQLYCPSPLPARAHIAGLEIEYLEAGDGPPLLYLHASEGADPADPLIARLAKEFRVMMPAHPGFGASETAPHLTSVDDLAYFYLDYLEARDVRDAVVVGSSFGAWLALAIATKDRSRIRSLVLDNPIGLRFKKRTERDFVDLYQMVPQEWSKVFLANDREDDRDWAKLGPEASLRAARNREAFTRMAWSPYLHDPKLASRLHRLQLPTLVLWGDQDKLASRGYADAFAAALPNAQLKVIPGAGHFAFHEAPDAVADAILSFNR